MKYLWVVCSAFCLFSCGPGEPENTIDTAPDTIPETTSIDLPPKLAEQPPSDLIQIGPYTADGGVDCDGFPRLNLETYGGLCVGIIASADAPTSDGTRGLRFPRTIIQHPVKDSMLIVDMGGWTQNRGALFELDGGTLSPVLRNLNLPHGLRLGTDGKLYIGEVHRLIRIDLSADDPAATLEVVLDDLPFEDAEGKLRRHPLKEFVFNENGNLFLNMGSQTDRCLPATDDVCFEEAQNSAALWEYEYLGDGQWSDQPVEIYRGLRNSMALAAHPSGTVVQAENSSDFKSERFPREELNIIAPGQHYGWPYCLEMMEPDPEWTGRNCQGDYAWPADLLPAHGAPLGMTYYNASLPGLNDTLIIPLHGYRAPGHRVLALDVDEKGRPTSPARDIVFGWQASDTGPRGAPVGISAARDGSLWLVEDKNKTVLRIAAETYATSQTPRELLPKMPKDLPHDPVYAALHTDIFKPKCAACHSAFMGYAENGLASLTYEGWLRDDGTGQSVLMDRLTRTDGKRMPIDEPLSEAELALVEAWLKGS